MADRRVRRALEGDTSLLVTRVMALNDMEILSRSKGGDGRTVVAYAAAFNRSAEIVDADGHYNEQIAPTAFNASLASGRQIRVFYNHARTLHGTPSESGSVPIGTPAEPPRPDGTGLLTVTRYNKTQLADDVLEAIRNGDITGQSFTGVFLQSDPERGPYLSRNGQLTTVTRREIGLIEYGPTPMPAYQDAAIVGVRNRELLMDTELEQDAPQERTTVTIHVDQGAQARAASPEPPRVPQERTGVPVHHTAVVDEPWDADENTSRLPDIKGRADAEKYLKVYAWYDASGPDPDHDDLPDTRGSWKLPHHMVAADGTPGAANINGVRAAMQRLGQMDPPLSSGDETAVKAHLQAHMDDWHKDHPADGGEGQRTATAAAPVQPGPPAKHPVTEENGKQGDTAMTDRQMTVEERAARQEQIRSRMAEIDLQYAGAALPDDARAEWDDLTGEMAAHTTAIRDSNSRAAYLQTIVASNPDATIPGADQGQGYDGQAPQGSRSVRGFRAPALNKGRPDNLYDVASARNDARSLEDMGRVYRERAKWAVDEATFPGALDGDGAIKGRLERLLARVDDPDTLSRNMLLTGSPEYRTAFGKLLISQNPAMLGQAEQRALQMGAPASFQSGSFPVPFQLDPTVILTSNGAVNALREIARVEQIVGKEWLGVTSQGITVTRANELAPASDGSPTLAQPGVAPTRVQAFVPFSVEVEQDWNGLMAEIAMMLADAKDVEEASTFLTGAGTGSIPQGVLTGTSGTAQQVLTAGTATSVAPGDVYALENAMPPRFRARASLLASKGGYNAIRASFGQLASAAGDVWVRPSAGTAPELLGYPAYENSNMSGLSTGATLMLMGDFKQFIIVDRIGMSVELVPHVFATGASGGAPAMPQGERGIYALWRNSSQVLVPNAFRYLQTH
jgi:HK97 family phage major capsid protein/HK97 family phage prohead protease